MTDTSPTGKTPAAKAPAKKRAKATKASKAAKAPAKAASKAPAQATRAPAKRAASTRKAAAAPAPDAGAKAVEALTAALFDVSGHLGALVATQTRMADSMAQLASQGATPPAPKPTDLSAVVAAIGRLGDGVTSLMSKGTASAPEPEEPAAPAPAPEPVAEPEPEPVAEPEPTPEPEPAAEPEPAPAAAAPAPPAAEGGLRVSVGHAAQAAKPSANLPPSIHRGEEAAGYVTPAKRAPDTSEQGYAVTVKPAIAVALGQYLPKALQKVSEVLGPKGGGSDS